MNDLGRFATYPSLRDRVVLVTGGGSGIGASMVEHFAAQVSEVNGWKPKPFAPNVIGRSSLMLRPCWKSFYGHPRRRLSRIGCSLEAGRCTRRICWMWKPHK